MPGTGSRADPHLVHGTWLPASRSRCCDLLPCPSGHHSPAAAGCPHSAGPECRGGLSSAPLRCGDDGILGQGWAWGHPGEQGKETQAPGHGPTSFVTLLPLETQTGFSQSSNLHPQAVPQIHPAQGIVPNCWNGTSTYRNPSHSNTHLLPPPLYYIKTALWQNL